MRRQKIALVVALVLVAVFAAFVLPLVTESPPAVLSVEKGRVELSQSPFREVKGQVQISAGSTVRTYPGSAASIIFFGSSVLRLEENTTLALTALDIEKERRKVSLKQDSGRIWNKLIRLSGIEDYSLETPDAVATVRGTAFDSNIRDNSTVISVVETSVNVTEKSSGRSATVGENRQTAPGRLLSIQALVEDSWIRENALRDKQFLLELRERIKAKYWAYLLIAKSQHKLTEERVNEYIDAALMGAYTEEQISSALKQLGIEIKV